MIKSALLAITCSSLFAIAGHARDGGLNTQATMMHNEASQGARLAQLALSSAGQTNICLVGMVSIGLIYI